MLFLDMAVNFAVLSIQVPMEIESQGESGCRVPTFSFFFSFFFSVPYFSTARKWIRERLISEPVCFSRLSNSNCQVSVRHLLQRPRFVV